MTDIYMRRGDRLERLELGFNVLPVRSVYINAEGMLVLDVEAGSDMTFAINSQGYLEVEYA